MGSCIQTLIQLKGVFAHNSGRMQATSRHQSSNLSHGWKKLGKSNTQNISTVLA